MPLSGQPIVCVASASWDAMWVNAQHLMSRLAKDNRVLYLNSMGLRAPGASRSDLVKIKNRLAEWFMPARELHPNVFVLSPIAIPLHKIALIRWLNERLLLWRVRSWMKKLGFERPILWIFLPTGLSLVGKLDERAVVYHCVDDYAENPGVPAARIRRMEGELLSAADLTFVTSPKLLNDRKDRTRQISYQPNTADVPRFRDDAREAPDAILRIRKKHPTSRILGYQGNISDYKTDLQLLERIAETFPEHQLLLVGPAGWGDPSTDISRLIARPNVHHVGRVEYAQLPAYLHGFDVCLIPLNLSESTRGSFPMKLYEYMACGKPIVATALPAFEPYRARPQLARLADTRDQFLQAVSKALADTGDEAVVRERIEEAEKNSWEQRVLDIGEKVAKVLQKEIP